MSQVFKISEQVAEALKDGKPVVALESTIISHGMPYPQNVETANAVERIVKENGCVPATVAVINGVLTVGCDSGEIELLGKLGTSVAKVSRRDLPVIVAKNRTEQLPLPNYVRVYSCRYRRICNRRNRRRASQRR